ncbi:hypothetical protein HHL28_03215 [Aerophototrophica crusticola]|uniref:Uncharacterized protein n=1 Tax=Aerophototrophica crusticola TaxID=1709002 RepID=A0A858R497_9PROT|nr:hypothetical protein HHL28_03215 [Rhodospirillaceae bacterium B3]
MYDSGGVDGQVIWAFFMVLAIPIAAGIFTFFATRADKKRRAVAEQANRPDLLPPDAAEANQREATLPEAHPDNRPPRIEPVHLVDPAGKTARQG